jgi:phage shock protein E
MRRRRIGGAAVFFWLIGIGLAAARAGAADAPRMTKEDLLALLGRPDVVVVDLRTERQWEGSKEKIRGAVREDPHAVASWAARYLKEKTVVLYCT